MRWIGITVLVFLSTCRRSASEQVVGNVVSAKTNVNRGYQSGIVNSNPPPDDISYEHQAAPARGYSAPTRGSFALYNRNSFDDGDSNTRSGQRVDNVVRTQSNLNYGSQAGAVDSFPSEPPSRHNGDDRGYQAGSGPRVDNVLRSAVNVNHGFQSGIVNRNAPADDISYEHQAAPARGYSDPAGGSFGNNFDDRGYQAAGSGQRVDNVLRSAVNVNQGKQAGTLYSGYSSQQPKINVNHGVQSGIVNGNPPPDDISYEHQAAPAGGYSAPTRGSFAHVNYGTEVGPSSSRYPNGPPEANINYGSQVGAVYSNDPRDQTTRSHHSNIDDVSPESRLASPSVDQLFQSRSNFNYGTQKRVDYV